MSLIFHVLCFHLQMVTDESLNTLEGALTFQSLPWNGHKRNLICVSKFLCFDEEFSCPAMEMFLIADKSWLFFLNQGLPLGKNLKSFRIL